MRGKLPSIRFLAKELRVSMITVKRAFDELELDGFINSVQGKGNFVAPQNKEFIKEEFLKKIEEKIMELYELVDMANIPLEEVVQMIKKIKEVYHE